MSGWIEPAAFWLVEVYLLSTVILTLASLAVRILRQPARRLVIIKSALISLVLLVAFSATARISQYQWHSQETSRSFTDNFCCPPSSAAPVSPPPQNLLEFVAEWADIPLVAVFAPFTVGAIVIVFWLGLGAIAAARLTSRALAAPDRLKTILDRIVGGKSRTPRLILSSRVLHPVAAGLIRPAIVLPVRFAGEEPERRIEAALAHEWTHIRNGDLWLLAVSRSLLPLLFAHPLYGMLRRQMRADQEALADAEAAVYEGRIAYAEALLCWSRADGSHVSGLLAPSLGLWGRSSVLRGRIALLLDHDFRVESSCPRRWRMGVRGISLAIIMILGLASINGSADWSLASSRTIQGEPHTHSVTVSPSSLMNATSPSIDCRCSH